MIKNLWAKRHALTAKFNNIQASDIADTELKSKFMKLKAKQTGFTLLELLVVVAILAAIAGTASIALQDTDARASAAAHVVMMDELNKGIRTFRVLNKNTLPTNFDSLIQTTAPDGKTDAAQLSVSAIEDVALFALTAPVAEILDAGGINSLRYVHADAAADPDGEGNCADVEALIKSRGNAVVAGNIFLSPAASGCGYSASLADDDAAAGYQYTSAANIMLWTGGAERIIGQDGEAFDTTKIAVTTGAITAGVAGAPVMMAVGLGPSSNLFNANDLGGLTTVPVYRHVSGTEYNRFTALFNIGKVNATSDGIDAADQVSLAAIVDGAGDTKEEELGEWDGTRNTI
ncbi:MAG: type II secretion system protein [Colwellia sp.]|nr:type II secretion system protein [Colwellia sp.]